MQIFIKKFILSFFRILNQINLNCHKIAELAKNRMIIFHQFSETFFIDILWILFDLSSFELSTIIRCVTKIKNCSGFMRVHRILKVWSLLTTKIIISPKQVELKRSTAQIPAAPLVHNDPPRKIFSSKNLQKIWSFLESLHRNLSEKLYMSQQIT